MNFLRLVPVMLSLVLLGAHCLRASNPVMFLFCLLLPFLLLFRQPWAARSIQAVLVVAVIEWLRTLAFLMAQRLSADEDWIRMALIMIAVAVFTGGSASVFQCRSLKARYRLVEEPGPPASGGDEARMPDEGGADDPKPQG